MYGPLPADCELRNDSALSALSAFAAADPPCAFTTFEFTMPSEVFATSTGIAGFGVFDLITTVYGPFAVVVIPASKNDGLPFTLTSRLNEKTTSAAVSRDPSEKRTFRRRLNVYVRASFDALYPVATLGAGCATSAPLNSRSVSYRARSTMPPVGSYCRCGSTV